MSAESLSSALGKLALSRKEPAPPAPRFLLVLDVNGLLCDRRRDPVPGLKADAKCGPAYVYDRPHAAEFLKWALQRFRVGVWSSARSYNLEPLVAHVFGPALRRHLRFAWAQEKCTSDGVVAARNGSTKPKFFKELRLLASAGHGTLGDILLVDDDPYKAERNPPHTAVHPRAYEVTDKRQDDGLGAQSALRRYLDDLSLTSLKTVPEYVKANAFRD